MSPARSHAARLPQLVETRLPAEAPPRPFLKWAGGKRRLAPFIAQHLPPSFGTYHEPFAGGAAVFFHLRPRQAVLSDVNDRLVRAYRAVRDDLGGVITALHTLPTDEASYLEIRELDVDRLPDTMVGAWLIYLSRTAFNGLYRVNRENRFNVPYGHPRLPVAWDVGNLQACSMALQSTRLEVGDFSDVFGRTGEGDVIYLDPPYAPPQGKPSFTRYTSTGFSLTDLVRLRDMAREARRRGAHVLVSNVDTLTVRRLFSDGFVATAVQARRTVAADPGRRGWQAELLLRAL
jgi:DNA adenine methylase